MELQELKEIWGAYDKKLDKNLQLNMALLRKMLFDKARFRIRWLFVIKVAEMLVVMLIFNYLIGFIMQHLAELQFSIPGIMMEVALLCYFTINLKILSLTDRLKFKNENEAIAPLQKRTQTIKLLIVKSVKYVLFLIPGYPVLLILIGKIIFNKDFFSPPFNRYLFSNIILGVLLLPLFIWIFRQLSQKEIKGKWAKSLLTGSGWHLASDVEGFLNEIEEFEKED